MSMTSTSGYDLTPLSEAERKRLAEDLTDEEAWILLHHGTERPGCGLLLAQKEPGTYTCRLCGLPLFRAGSKFESGTGWPSFTTPFDPEHVATITDRSHGMLRQEIRCRRCDGHLGHVFDDGPPPTGLRYCMNSASLQFTPDGQELPKRAAADQGRE
jgi:peptide-methionine (R)-S-oxide reductase